MALWSLFSAILFGVARIPSYWSVPSDVDAALKQCTPFENGRYCYICQTLKPDRSHHCSSCGRCVVKFDHHCPWINQCVNYANYKPFLLYIFYSTLTVIW
ncbi:unnamed protein product [Nippostrongylus brasiliensis]|uniref:Palmitoyltransferase n=1 Tax=Nippostrongylus brasiliensis TaxID=27835 RepID=A0A0N4Y4K4_NIPBR|nr:unnamed protein product [Nippostrongylus brasiliensis]